MRKALLLLLAVPLLMAAAPNKNLTGTIEGPVGTLQYGQTVTFSVPYTEPKGIKYTQIAYLQCYQDRTAEGGTDHQFVSFDLDYNGSEKVVFDGIEENPWPITFTLVGKGTTVGGFTPWSGGAAQCTLDVWVYEWKGIGGYHETESYLMATTSFDVAA